MPDSLKIPSPEQIESLLESGQMEALQASLADYHPTDIAHMLDDLSPANAVSVFRLLPLEIASEVLDETHSLVRQELVEQVRDDRLADLLETLPEDDAAEFLAGLPDDYAETLLELMEPQEAEEVRELLSYDEQTAGRLMVTDVARLRSSWPVAQALDYLRHVSDDEILHYLYAVDDEDTLVGVVPLRSLVTAPSEALIENILLPEVVAILDTADQEELAKMVARYDYVSLPVVDVHNRLLGVVTVDDVVDILAEEATEDIQRLGGSEPLAQPYFSATLREIVSKRVIWLLLLFVASTLTGIVIRSFEELLMAFVILNAFIPLITGTGGNAGSQTVATIIRAMAVGDVNFADIGRAWQRELSAGLLLGLILGAIGFVQAMIWTEDFNVALVIGLTLPAVVMWANTTATVVPIVAERFKIDPTVISAPMITTIVDATGLLIFFSIGRALLV